MGQQKFYPNEWVYVRRIDNGHNCGLRKITKVEWNFSHGHWHYELGGLPNLFFLEAELSKTPWLDAVEDCLVQFRDLSHDEKLEFLSKVCGI